MRGASMRSAHAHAVVAEANWEFASCVFANRKEHETSKDGDEGKASLGIAHRHLNTTRSLADGRGMTLPSHPPVDSGPRQEERGRTRHHRNQPTQPHRWAS